MLSRVPRALLAPTPATRCMASGAPGYIGGLFRDYQGQTPLTEDFPGVPAPQAVGERPATKPIVTTLENGIRVVSQETYRPAVAVDVFVGYGSRDETAATAGFADFMRAMAFKTTATRSHLRTVRDSEDAGLTLKAEHSREFMRYSGSGLRNNTEALVDLLSETVFRPVLAQWEVNAWQALIAEYKQTAENASCCKKLCDALHAAAYRDNTPLGHGSVLYEDVLGSIKSEDLRNFAKQLIAGDRVVVSAAGVEHGELVRLVQAKTGAAPRSASSAGARASSPFFGGEVRVRKASDCTGVSIGFEAPAAGHSKDVYTAGVVKHLLGHIRFTRPAIASITADTNDTTSFYQQYSDSGILGVTTWTCSSSVQKAVGELAATLKAASQSSSQDVARGRALYKSAYFASRDSAKCLSGSLGSHLLQTGDVCNPSAVVAGIDSVTADDVNQFLSKALRGKVAVASIGNINNMPYLADVQGLLH